MPPEILEPTAMPRLVIFKNLPLPVYCQFGNSYYRIESQHRSMRVVTYDFFYGITCDETWETKSLINGVETGTHALVTEAEFNRVLDENAAKLGLKRA